MVLIALGYAGIYFYYGVVVEREIQQQLDSRGLFSVNIDNVEYALLAPLAPPQILPSPQRYGRH